MGDVNVTRQTQIATIAAMEIRFSTCSSVGTCSLVRIRRTIRVRSSPHAFAQPFRERDMKCGSFPETGADPTRHLIRMNYCLRSENTGELTWLSTCKCSRINNMKAG